jgi:hypothetical protein
MILREMAEGSIFRHPSSADFYVRLDSGGNVHQYLPKDSVWCVCLRTGRLWEFCGDEEVLAADENATVSELVEDSLEPKA